MTTYSYLVTPQGKVLARMTRKPCAANCVYSFDAVKEKINAAREFCLVNPKHGRISNAKKWEAAYAASFDAYSATEINPGQYLLS